MAALNETLWQLGHTAWASLEGCLGAEPLRLLAEVSRGSRRWGGGVVVSMAWPHEALSLCRACWLHSGSPPRPSHRAWPC